MADHKVTEDTFQTCDDFHDILPSVAGQDGRRRRGEQVRNRRVSCRRERVRDTRRPLHRVVRYMADGKQRRTRRRNV